MGIHTSGNPSIRRHGHLFNVERLAPLSRAQENTGLQPWSSSFRFAQVLFIDDRHLYSFHDLLDSKVEPGNAEVGPQLMRQDSGRAPNPEALPLRR
jgi:hypothetical protein